MARLLGFLLMLLVVVIGVSFTVLNAQPVEINYYLGIREVPLAFIVVIAVAFGAVLGLFGGMFKLVSVSRENRRLRRHVRVVEKEVVNLRPITMEDAD